MNGFGVLITINKELNYKKDKYEGQFVNSVKQGKGKMSYGYPLDVYEGSWSKDKFNGFGVYTYDIKQADAYKYEGYWVDGKKEGQGKMYLFMGYYDGNWHDDKRNGTGTFYEKNGTVTKGKWENNVQIAIDSVYNLNSGKFVGKLKDGKKSGKGQLYLTDGTIIEGKFANDELVGKGKIIYLDGTVYEGEIKDNKASGIGKTIDGNYGPTHTGNYLNGKMHGLGTDTYSRGNSFVGEWSEGKRLRGKYFDFQGKFQLEGSVEDYIEYCKEVEIWNKAIISNSMVSINADKEAKRKAEEARQNSLTEEEKLIEKHPCPVCAGKGTYLCGGEYIGTKVVETRTYGNVTYTDEVTEHSASKQCPCNFCNGKKYYIFK